VIGVDESVIKGDGSMTRVGVLREGFLEGVLGREGVGGTEGVGFGNSGWEERFVRKGG
jgi:hypothetical protein